MPQTRTPQQVQGPRGQPAAPGPAAGVTAADWLARFMHRHRWWIFAAIALLYVIGFNGQWRPAGDTASYALIAQQWLEQGQTSAETGRHPGTAMLFAISIALLGEHDVRLVVVAIWLMGLAVLVLSYRLFTLEFGPPAAIAILGLLAINRTLYEYTLTQVSAVPFLLGLLVMLLGFARHAHGRGPAWANVLLVAAGVAWMATFRSVVLVVLAAVLLTLVWQALRDHGRRGWRAWAGLGAFVIAGLVTLLVVRTLDPRLAHPLALNPDEQAVLRHLTTWFHASVADTFTVQIPALVLVEMPVAVFGERLRPLGLVLTPLVILLGVLLARRQVLWGMIVALIVIQTAAFWVTSRYYVALLPLLAAGWWTGAVWLEQHIRWRWVGYAAFALMLLLWIVPNAIRTAAVVQEQRATPFLMHYKDGRYAQAKALAPLLREHVEPGALIVQGADKGHRELAFFSGRSVQRASDIRFFDAELQREPWYVLEPGSDGLDRFVRLWRLELGEPVLERAHVAGADETWRLRRAYRPAVDEAQIDWLYRRIAFRDAQPYELAARWEQIRSGLKPLPGTVVDVLQTDRYRQRVEPVLRLHLAFAPELPDRATLQRRVVSGTALQTMAARWADDAPRPAEAFVDWALRRALDGDAPRPLRRELIDELDAGRLTRAQVLARIIDEPAQQQAMRRAAALTAVCYGLLDRPPSADELARWSRRLRGRDEMVDIIAELLASPASQLPAPGEQGR